MKLQIEYTCTNAEMKEAQAFQLRELYGGASKWRTRLVLFGILALTSVPLYFRFRNEIAPKDRLWFIALVVVVYVAFLTFKRMTHQKTNRLVRLEVSDREVVFSGDNGRAAILWSAFSKCLESPKLFVLVNRSKTILYAVPKRVFPDEAAQNWFRGLANQPQSVAAAAVDETLMPGRTISGRGISLTFQLKHRDYLNRVVTSWRTKGFCIGILLLLTGINFFSTPPPDAVNSPLKVEMIMIAIITPMLVVLVLAIPFVSWRREKKYLVPQQILLRSEGIEFTSRDSTGRLPWRTYKYFLENRWSFFVWHPRGSLWLMFPKREFVSQSDLSQFRNILQTTLTPSLWFYL